MGILFSNANSSLKATDCTFHGFLNVINPGGVLRDVSKNVYRELEAGDLHAFFRVLLTLIVALPRRYIPIENTVSIAKTSAG